MRRCQVFRALEIGATVLIIGIEKGHEKIIAQIIMLLCDAARPAPRLEIKEQCGKVGQEKLYAFSYFIIEISGKNPVDKLIHLAAAP